MLGRSLLLLAGRAGGRGEVYEILPIAGPMAKASIEGHKLTIAPLKE